MPNSDNHEIVIIRRRPSLDIEAGHGGVWKIAFADFMTAMMAFFLVMWLISASDKTRATVARYFNPMQLVDTTTQPFGINNPNKDMSGVKPSSVKPSEPAREQGGKPDQNGKTPAVTEATLFQDPYATLAKIAGQTGSGSPRQSEEPNPDKPRTGSDGMALNKGEAYRDPFAPAPPPPPPPTVEPSDEVLPASPPAGTTAAATPAAATPAAAPPTAAQPAPPAPAPLPAAASPRPQGPVWPKAGRAPDQPAKPASAGTAEAADLRGKIETAARASAQPEPKIDVQNTDEGILISLTDDADFAMFAIGSAEPDRRVVLLMDKIAAILKTRPGKIVVRGFTDGRAYKSAVYDNWRLSSARAQMVHYMLVRGGLDEQRIERIEGYADRRLKTPADPNAPENRRIEILLRGDKP